MRWCSFVGVCCSQPKYVSIIVNCNEEVIRKVEVVVQDMVQEIVRECDPVVVVEGEGILRRRNTSFVVGSAVVPGCGKGPNGSCAEKCRCHRGGLRACCEPNAKMLLPCLQGLRV